MEYVYYHCTRQQRSDLQRKSNHAQRAHAQVNDILASIQISEKFKEWSLKYLYQYREEESETQEMVMESHHKSH